MAPAQGWHAKSWSVPHFLATAQPSCRFFRQNKLWPEMSRVTKRQPFGYRNRVHLSRLWEKFCCAARRSGADCGWLGNADTHRHRVESLAGDLHTRLKTFNLEANQFMSILYCLRSLDSQDFYENIFDIYCYLDGLNIEPACTGCPVCLVLKQGALFFEVFLMFLAWSIQGGRNFI